jgi:hypothetical protein
LAFAQAGELLQLARTIVLPDVHGRIDHLDIDVEGARLFVAALGNNSVEVIDLRAGRRSARLERLREPQGRLCRTRKSRRSQRRTGQSHRLRRKFARRCRTHRCARGRETCSL